MTKVEVCVQQLLDFLVDLNKGQNDSRKKFLGIVLGFIGSKVKIVPLENLDRPKMGFTISLEDWFKGDLTKFYLSKVNKKSMLNEFVKINGINTTGNREKWSLLVLELWLNNYFSNQ